MLDPLIRLARPGDGPGLVELQQVLDRETEFMLLEPGEREPDPGPLEARLADGADGRDLSYLVVALAGAVAVGYVDVSVLSYARARRTGYVVAGVCADHSGRGLGRALMRSAVEEARSRGMGRLELTVMEHNRRALGLYLACGFQVEGLRRAALEVHGRRINEYYMGLLLD
ncbi:GNAT family N-acetyltransferase [Streptomyces chiangmaiensis]|uniref:GNAT family N-acetyltransferase n=1 Tax=Streptomyces chiangmaiensis TaxID=766497 RepID=A0ABU7FW51_9ACTN|nr:GNAT family N-acetyltransferase [Streptomyces chiangmaiensis]MED7828345.1 GNAT family N-acetyltransferase [Streptomyces chiangmaiensis]